MPPRVNLVIFLNLCSWYVLSFGYPLQTLVLLSKYTRTSLSPSFAPHRLSHSYTTHTFQSPLLSQAFLQHSEALGERTATVALQPYMLIVMVCVCTAPRKRRKCIKMWEPTSSSHAGSHYCPSGWPPSSHGLPSWWHECSSDKKVRHVFIPAKILLISF